MRIHVFILICYLNNISSTLLQSNLLDKRRELRKKISRLFNGKQSNEMFLNIDEYEYPRANDTLRKIYKQQWLNYYACLKDAYAHSGRERITCPSALVALEGTSVTLKCQICISPLEMHATDLIQWYFNSDSEVSVTGSLLEDIGHIDNSPDNQYIVMYNLKSEQAGVYWCEMGDTVGSVYYLHIDNDFEAIDVVYPDTAARMPQAASARSVPEYGLKVYTTWTTWSLCSTCDVSVGIKLRYGYCTISLLEIKHDRCVMDENTSTIDELRRTREEVQEYDEWNQTVETATRIMVNESLRVQLRMALLLFKNRLPCKSRFVPKRIQMIAAIKNRKTQVMRRYCKKQCRKNVVFEVRDERGNILESANNSAGIYSMVQSIPKPLPPVLRNVIYEERDKKIKLVCPGNLNMDVPIVWQIDDKIINPSQIERQSNGRIRINSQKYVIFRSLRLEDAGIYSCWQNNELAGVIKLNISGESKLKLNRYVISIGAILIIGVFLVIFWRAFKSRTRYTIH